MTEEKRRVDERQYFCHDFLEINFAPSADDFCAISSLQIPKNNEAYSMSAELKSEMEERRKKRRAENRLIRIVRTNFSPADVDLHLTYKYAPESLDLACRDIRNFFRRLKRVYTKKGAELKYVWVADKGKVNGRIHFHGIITGGVVSNAELKRIWNLGRICSKPLNFDTDGLEGYVKYILKCKLLYRRYNCSKNMEKPFLSIPSVQLTTSDLWLMEQKKDCPQFFEKRYPGYKFFQIKTYKKAEGCVPIIKLVMVVSSDL